MTSSGSGKIVPLRPPPVLRLSCWTARDKPLLATLVLAAFGGLAVVGATLSESVAMGCLSFGALVLSAWRLWVPVSYEIGPRGITQELLRRQRLIRWSDVGRCELRPYGVLLLPDSEVATHSVLRGLYIHCYAREKLLETVEYYLSAPRHRGSSVVPQSGRG